MQNFRFGHVHFTYSGVDFIRILAIGSRFTVVYGLYSGHLLPYDMSQDKVQLTTCKLVKMYGVEKNKKLVLNYSPDSGKHDDRRCNNHIPDVSEGNEMDRKRRNDG